VTVPRSSKDTLAGLAHLPRMIDKVRAFRNNTLGEYIYPCPLDWHVLKFMAMSPEDFADLAETNDNAQIAEWAEETGCFRNTEERIFVFKVHAFDWNCPQHITPRYTQEEISKGLAQSAPAVTG